MNYGKLSADVFNADLFNNGLSFANSMLHLPNNTLLAFQKLGEEINKRDIVAMVTGHMEKINMETADPLYWTAGYHYMRLCVFFHIDNSVT